MGKRGVYSVDRVLNRHYPVGGQFGVVYVDMGERAVGAVLDYEIGVGAGRRVFEVFVDVGYRHAGGLVD